MQGGSPMKRVSEIRPEHGVPALYINGKRELPVIYGLSDFPAANSNTAQAFRNIRNFAAQGIHLVQVDSNLLLGWRRVTPFDGEALKAEIAGALDANPEAGVILRLHMNPPYWWMRDNPDELVIYREEDGREVPGLDNGESDRLIRDDGAHHMRVSLASEKWKQEAGAALAALCDQLIDTKEGDALVGIQVACGVYGEWHQWGVDCGKPMRARFRRYLREKYATEENLQKAWHDPAVTFDTASFLPETTRPGDDGIFRDPAKAQNTMDAQECIQRTGPEAILHFCRIIKEKMPGVLAGTFYGYYQGCGQKNICIQGHLMPELLYEAKGIVEFLCGPFPYMDNRKPEGIPLQRGLLESSRLRGMLWLTEMDQHPVGTEYYVGGDPEKWHITIAQLRRNALQPLLSGQGMWYYDHRIIPQLVDPNGQNSEAGSVYRKNGWWEVPELMQEIGRLRELGEKYLLKDYKPAADVLIVYDPKTHFALSDSPNMVYDVVEAIARNGVVYDCIYLNELEVAQLNRYRCVVMFNTWRMSGEQRVKIQRLLRDRPTVWLYAPGYCEENLDATHIFETVGMKAYPTEKETGCVTPEGRSLSRMIEAFPQFAICDETAEPWAVYTQSGKTAAARKGNKWYFAGVLPDPLLMRHIFEITGVHMYIKNGVDPVLAGNGLVAVNTTAGGEMTLCCRSGREIPVILPPYTTAVFDEQTGERVL